MSPEHPAAAFDATKVNEEVTILITPRHYPTPTGLDLDVSTLLCVARPSGADGVTNEEDVG